MKNRYLLIFVAVLSFVFVACNQSKKSDSQPQKSTSQPEKSVEQPQKSTSQSEKSTEEPKKSTKLVTPTEKREEVYRDVFYMEPSGSNAPKHDLPAYFFNKKWMRSPGEDSKFGGEVYRLESFKRFEPMRFRPTFIFKEDYTCEYLKLSPNDAHAMGKASWAYNLSKQMRIFSSASDENREVYHNWTIVKIAKNMLVVKSIEAAQRRN